MPWNPSELMRNNLSVATARVSNPQNAPIYTQAALTPPGPSAQSVLDKPEFESGVLRYPDETPMYYMEITTYKYVRTAWNVMGKSQWEKMIVMPMATQLIDSQEVRYSTEPLGVAGAVGTALGTSAAQFFADLSNGTLGGALGNQLDHLKNLVTGGKMDATGLGLSHVLSSINQGGPRIEALIRGGLAAAGVAQNEFLTVMLEGPKYKVRDFHWKLSPNNPKETQALSDIILHLNNSQAPSISGMGYAFFSYPKVFEIKFKFLNSPIGNVLFNMKPMVLVNSAYNYTPHGVYAPYTGTHGPDSVEIRLNFLELELWVNSNAGPAYTPQGGSTFFPPSISTPNPNVSSPGDTVPQNGGFAF
jgi:hypothetical protein